MAYVLRKVLRRELPRQGHGYPCAGHNFSRTITLHLECGHEQRTFVSQYKGAIRVKCKICSESTGEV